MRDETPRASVPTDADRLNLEAELIAVAERLLPQLTDDEWVALQERFGELRRRLRQQEFDQRIGYWH